MFDLIAEVKNTMLSGKRKHRSTIIILLFLVYTYADKVRPILTFYAVIYRKNVFI